MGDDPVEGRECAQQGARASRPPGGRDDAPGAFPDSRGDARPSEGAPTVQAPDGQATVIGRGSCRSAQPVGW